MRKVFRTIAFLFFILFTLIHFFTETEEEEVSLPEDLSDEYQDQDSITGDLEMIHTRKWKDVNDSKRTLSFSVPAFQRDNSFIFRNAIAPFEDGTEKEFWRSFYFELYDHDKEGLLRVRDSLLSLAQKQTISASDLIYTTVSMVQDIPYSYVLPYDSCAFYTDYPCVPLQRYGILSPIEFLYSLSGDCDTRTVLLFTLLKNLGYNPIIVNSYQYHHSMLAVDVPTAGDSFTHKGRKFYFWETTSTGWLPGMLPPEMNNVNYWTIILDYEFQADPARPY